MLFIIFSCNDNGQKTDPFVEITPVEVDKNKSSSITECIDKIEVFPLETDSISIFSIYKKVVYCHELEMFIVLDQELTVSLFSEDGMFIANSRSKQGQGPGEYLTIVDVVYNPFLKTIELLDPYGSIYRYDTSFQFVEKISLHQSELVFMRFAPFGVNQYILNPVVFFVTDAVVYFCDYDKNTISKPISYESDFISTVTMNMNSFFIQNGTIFLSPLGFDYNFYQIDTNEQTLSPIIQLDFGKKNVQKKEIKNMFEYPDKTSITDTAEDMESNMKKMGKINDYLLNSDYPLPIVKFFNDQYVYVHILAKHKRSGFIYNRKTKEGFLQAEDSSFKMYPCFDIHDNILIAMVPSYELDRYVDKQYMNQENLVKLEKVEEEEEDYIIVKYYLK